MNELLPDIMEMENFRAELEAKALNHPIDDQSLNVIHKDVVIQQGAVIIPFSLVNYTEPFEVSINGHEYNLESTPQF